MKFRYHKLFLAKFSSLVYISLKIGYFELGHDYDVTVTLYLRSWYFISMYGKKGPLHILWDQLYVWGGFIFKFTGGGNQPPLGKLCYKERLGRRGLRCCNWEYALHSLITELIIH